jgi:hypothetical protein
MTGPWHGRLRKLARRAGTVLARLLPGAEAMTRRGADERRADAVTADVVQVGIFFMHVFGRDNAEAFFCTAEIEPAVYRRILAGRFRRMVDGGDAESEGVLA